MYRGGMELHASAGLAVVHPEGDIHALDLLQMVGFGEGRRQQRLFVIVLLQRLNGILLAQLKGSTKSGFKMPLNCPGITDGFPQYGQDVAAVVASQISSAPHDGQQ